MKTFKKVSLIVLSLAFMFGLAGLIKAATTVNLGTADSFAVLAGSTITNTGSSVITGDLGLSPGLATSITGFPPGLISGTQYANDAVAIQAKVDLVTAYDNAAGQIPATTVPTELGGTTKTPGVYSAATLGITGTLVLDAQNNPDAVFIFKAGSTLITANNSIVSLINGAQACHVFWQVGSSATLGTDSVFKGNILALTSATLTTGANVEGRVLARNGAVTLDTNVITRATCAVAPESNNQKATITVVKNVINDNGRTKTVADFPLFVNGTPVVSGITNVFPAPASMYHVTETTDVNYTRSFSGDCDANGDLNLFPGRNEICIVTNNDIGAPAIVPVVPPLIDVVKVPSPLALPSGPGLVNYTYSVSNIGTVPVTDLTMVGDTCIPIVLTSGDTDSDAKLDTNETWVYNCATTLTETHTNTVVATGWANGLSATDIASATVIVDIPVVPPLIHVTKVPSPLTLLAGGGLVTYTEKITNPGTVDLSNITLVDDKCSPMKYVSGDLNHDYKIQPTETFTYTCQSKLTETTTNTAIATGEANGLVVRDVAIATVVVASAAPTLPNTGTGPGTTQIIIFMVSLALVSVALTVVLKKRLT